MDVFNQFCLGLSAGFVADTCATVASVRAGDVLLVPDTLLRIENLGAGAMRIGFHYSYQHSGTVPAELPVDVVSRLSNETKILMEYAHALHAKPIAAVWVQSFSSLYSSSSSNSNSKL